MSSLAEGSVEKGIAIGIANPLFEQLTVEDVESRPGASIQYVYCSGIEAWTVVEFRRTLSAILRILEPSGIVRIAAQDLDAIIYGYLLEWNNSQPANATRGQQINAWRKSQTAQYVFNEEDLRVELENAGFVDIWRLPAGASTIEIFRGCEQHELMELALEGRKPALTE
jgi:predicted SAM-dependent methyltransferase